MHQNNCMPQWNLIINKEEEAKADPEVNKQKKQLTTSRSIKLMSENNSYTFGGLEG